MFIASLTFVSHLYFSQLGTMKETDVDFSQPLTNLDNRIFISHIHVLVELRNSTALVQFFEYDSLSYLFDTIT